MATRSLLASISRRPLALAHRPPCTSRFRVTRRPLPSAGGSAVRGFTTPVGAVPVAPEGVAFDDAGSPPPVSTTRAFPGRRAADGNTGGAPSSFLDLDARRIALVDSLRELERLVLQLEQLPHLTAADVGPRVVPLSRKLSKVPLKDRDAARAALLAERVLFACLKHLPSARAARTAGAPYPPATLYNRCIIAWGNLRTVEGAARAERILHLMVAEHEADPDRAAPPDRRCYKSALRAWAVAQAQPGARHPDARGVEKACAYLEEMEELSGLAELLGRDPEPASASRRSFAIDPPDRMVYNSVLSSLAKSFITGDEPVALERIKSIVARMDRLYALTSGPGFALDGYSYHSILRAYSRYAAVAPGSLSPAYLDEVVAVLARMHREGCVDQLSELVDMAWAYGVVMEVLLKTDPWNVNVSRAHDYLLALAGRSNQTLGVPIHPSKTLWPRHASIIRMVRAWRRMENDPKAQDKIEELINIAVTAPYRRVYYLNEAMEEWVQSGLDLAPEVVERMLAHAMDVRNHTDVKPTGESYLIASKAWLRSSAPDAPYRAERVLDDMLRIYRESNDRFYEPREQHLRMVATTWLSKCRDGRRYKGMAGMKYPAEHIEALLHYHQGSEWFVKSAPGLYAMALRAWAVQNIDDSPDNPCPLERSEHLIDLLGQVQKSAILLAFPCNWVLGVCSRKFDTQDKRHKAYQLAVDTFGRSQHNARSYVLMSQVIKRQVGDGFNEAHALLESIESLFHNCCAAGMLSQDMIWEVLEVATTETLQKLFGVSHQYATGIVQVRDGQLGKSHSGLVWEGKLPNALRCENLPHSWRSNASRGSAVQ